MRQDAGPMEAPVADYVRRGWSVEDPKTAQGKIPFRPDYLLRRGNDYLVVEVQKQGSGAARPIAAMRRAVESLPGWQFTVEVLPPLGDARSHEIADDEVGSRLTVADDLFEAGHRDEAIVIAWIAIETSLRRLVSAGRASRSQPELSDLLRIAYEEDLIADSELRDIIAFRDLRNRIAHGFKTATDLEDARSVLSMAHHLADRADPVPGPALGGR